MAQSAADILVVDDDRTNRELLRVNLEEEGYAVRTAAEGAEGLRLLAERACDAVLLDLEMPVMDGFEMLRRMKADEALRHIPVIVVSSMDDMASVVRCIESGAMDHLNKPFDPVLLHARINASLTTKRMHDQEKAYLALVEAEHERSERLLLNILPGAIAGRLKTQEGIIADYYEAATVLFADIVGFTEYAKGRNPAEVVTQLNGVFSGFDSLVERHGIEKIKTIGDAYMLASGVPIARTDHADAAAEVALEMLEEVGRLNERTGLSFNIRVGMNSGPVVAGVIGIKKFAFDLWGDTVNIASRMESHGVPGFIQVSAATWDLLRDRYNFDERGKIPVKGHGAMKTYLLRGRRAGPGRVG